MPRKNCQAKTLNNCMCKKNGLYIFYQTNYSSLNNSTSKKYCYIHSLIYHGKSILLIQRTYRNYKQRKLTDNLYKCLPYDLKHKVIYHIREPDLIHKHHHIILRNIITKKILKIFTNNEYKIVNDIFAGRSNNPGFSYMSSDLFINFKSIKEIPHLRNYIISINQYGAVNEIEYYMIVNIMNLENIALTIQYYMLNNKNKIKELLHLFYLYYKYESILFEHNIKIIMNIAREIWVSRHSILGEENITEIIDNPYLHYFLKRCRFTNYY